jgi:hypothetical protein
MYNWIMGKSSMTEAEILTKVVRPTKGDLSVAAARSFLGLRFDAATTKSIRRLLEKNGRGTISSVEQLTLERFLRVGQFLDLLHAKAKLSLKRSGDSR